jgi:hypothetical protein
MKPAALTLEMPKQMYVIKTRTCRRVRPQCDGYNFAVILFQDGTLQILPWQPVNKDLRSIQVV